LIILCPDQDFDGEKWKMKFGEAAQNYVDALRKEGADVLVLRGYEQNYEMLMASMDGWLIPGGLDIDPTKYHAIKHPKTVSLESHELRFKFEVEMYKKLPKTLPILGICYGSQLLNVLNGKKPLKTPKKSINFF
jgi:putative glutamine amidotransferase